MNYSNKCVELVKSFEGCELTAYQDQVGVWTIGYGHTGYFGMAPIQAGDTCTESQANELLLGDMDKAAAAVNRLTDGVTLNQNQFDALIDFVFNLGEEALAYSTLLKLLRLSRFVDAAEEFVKWDHAGHRVIEGLLKRRTQEQELFLAQVEAAA